MKVVISLKPGLNLLSSLHPIILSLSLYLITSSGRRYTRVTNYKQKVNCTCFVMDWTENYKKGYFIIA